MKSRLLILSILVALSVLTHGQSSVPVIVPAVSSDETQGTKAQTGQEPAASSDALRSAIQQLEHTKTVNGELLKTQEATLQQLDEMQKQAEQLKIYSKRG